MTDPGSPRAIAAAWQPQLPGRRATRHIADAIVEPDWGGARVVAALSEHEAALYAHGREIGVAPELLTALLDGFRADGAVIEGHLTTSALRSGEGAFPPIPRVERAPMLVPKAFRRSVKDDPFVQARIRETQARDIESAVLEALERGERHAFVATDLLWLDGQSLLEIPLLERKRQLETVIAESFLVRVTAFVRASAMVTLASWGTLGFRELFYRAPNSRYLPGRENPDWAIGWAPDAPAGAPKPAPPPR